MLAWLTANIGTIAVGALVLAAAALAVRSLIKDKKQGKSPCGGCSGCSGCAGCHDGSRAQNENR